MEDITALCRRLVAHFTFEPGEIPPDLSGFRAREGLSLAEFLSLAEREEVKAALKEARERYLDTLTAGCLSAYSPRIRFISFAVSMQSCTECPSGTTVSVPHAI